MAISDPITYAFNAGTITLNRINQDNYSSVYYGTGTNIAATLTVKHTIPKAGLPGESHLVRFDYDELSATTGEIVRRTSAWVVVRTDIGGQDVEMSEDVAESLVDFLSDANITKVVGRQS
jgi:hypothetical protein